MPKKKTPAPASPKGPTTGRQSTSQPQCQQIPLSQLNPWPRLVELASRGIRRGELFLLSASSRPAHRELCLFEARPATGKSEFFQVFEHWQAARRQQLEGHRAIIQAIQSLWPSR